MRISLKRIMTTLCAALLMAGAPAWAQDKPVPYQEGLHYFLIDQAPAISDEPMQLVEAFSYLCTHCNTFEPYINSWKKRKPEHVSFRRLPVVFGRGSWELYARAYVTAEMMNVAEEAHGALMDRLWKDKQIMRSMDELAAFYSQFGVDPEKFVSTSKSFVVDGRIRKDQALVQSWGIRGTPSLVLNGKYRVSGNAAVPSFEVMLDVIDYLIELESAGR